MLSWLNHGDRPRFEATSAATRPRLGSCDLSPTEYGKDTLRFKYIENNINTPLYMIYHDIISEIRMIFMIYIYIHIMCIYIYCNLAALTNLKTICHILRSLPLF